ncbi:hypothetical protein SAMN04487819_11657 [Actinopolyspora alba]|uniref:Uncharacterized protein n=1 Tax=Actinopolyspora alba TaxID=673379 RepID=A0A1I2BE61_9ACTN|nr:hypothetical protein [Actinopolyspora alba]SFE54435.1 hypothetical protein SAMN04487819_11657 [Actinopolyspora alba]
MSRDYLRSVARTWLPMVWGAVVGWLVTAEIVPASMAPEIQASLMAGSVPIVGGLLYAAARWFELRLPRWVRRLVFGSVVEPNYNQ